MIVLNTWGGRCYEHLTPVVQACMRGLTMFNDSQLYALTTRRSNLIATCDLEDGPSETLDCTYLNGVLYTPLGAIAMDVKALSVWLKSAAPGDYWQSRQLATAA